MNQKPFQRTTFAALDREKGVAELPAVAGDEYPLPAWYRSVREVPIEELSIEDIAKDWRINKWGAVPIFVRREWDGPLAKSDSCFFASPKALRQQIHPEYVVPRALQILRADPLAGEIFDGELFASLKAVAPAHWVNHSDDTASLQVVIERLLRDPTTADDIRRDAEELREKLGIGH